MLSDTMDFWRVIEDKVAQTVAECTGNTLRCERYDVTTPPNGSVIGVKQPFGDRELFIPYTTEVSGAKAGQTVLVVWWGSLSNAKALSFGDGPQ